MSSLPLGPLVWVTQGPVTCPGFSVCITLWSVLSITLLQSSTPKVDHVHGSVLLLFKCLTIFQPQFRLSNFAPNPQDHRLARARSLMFFYRHTRRKKGERKYHGSFQIHPLLLQIVSRGNTHLPPRLIQKTPDQEFWHSEVHVRRLRILFLHRIWLVSIVMTLVVTSSFGCVSSTILVVPLYISFSMYRWPKW